MMSILRNEKPATNTDKTDAKAIQNKSCYFVGQKTDK